MTEQYIVVLVTTSSTEEAEKIARRLVEERLVACGNIIAGVTSIFRWEGKISTESEALLILKTRADLFDRARKLIEELHSYDVPEVIALPIVRGNEQYLKWLAGETS